MKNTHTELVFVLDRSGSMHGLEEDAIGGFNSLLKENQELKESCKVSTILFDNQIELIHDRFEIEKIKPLTEKEYYVRGSTSLLDAIGTGITKIQHVQKHQDCKVLFVIITDGYENSSREYSGVQIKNMINENKKKGWEFIFLGANIDVEQMADEYGIDKEKARAYHSDKQGVMNNYNVMSQVVKNYRQGQTIDAASFKDIDEDYKSRKKGH